MHLKSAHLAQCEMHARVLSKQERDSTCWLPAGGAVTFSGESCHATLDGCEFNDCQVFVTAKACVDFASCKFLQGKNFPVTSLSVHGEGTKAALHKCTFAEVKRGLLVWDGGAVEASDVHMTGVRRKGVQVHGENSYLHMVSSCIVGAERDNMTDEGHMSDQCGLIAISQGRMFLEDVECDKLEVGFRCRDGGKCELCSCTATDCDYAVSAFRPASEMTMQKCTCKECRTGLMVTEEASVSADGCHFTKNGKGVAGYESTVVLTRCTSMSERQAYCFEQCSLVSLESCQVSACVRAMGVTACRVANVNDFKVQGCDGTAIVVVDLPDHENEFVMTGYSVDGAEYGMQVGQWANVKVKGGTLHGCTIASVSVQGGAVVQMEDVVCTGAQGEACGFKCVCAGSKLRLCNCSSDSSQPFVAENTGTISWYTKEPRSGRIYSVPQF